HRHSLLLLLLLLCPPSSPLFPYTTLFRSGLAVDPLPAPSRAAPELASMRVPESIISLCFAASLPLAGQSTGVTGVRGLAFGTVLDRKSTRLNSSHLVISYAVFCLKKKKRV